jgi:hypothetical protein
MQGKNISVLGRIQIVSRNFEIQTDNPAGRLYALLIKAKGQNGSGYKIWGNVLGIPWEREDSDNDKSMIEIAEGVIQLRKLIDEVESALTRIEGINLSLYLTPFRRIRDSIKLSRLPTPNYDSHLNVITEGDMTVLAFCADTLSKYVRESAVDEDQLKELLDSITKLYTDVFDSSLDEEFKIFILDELEMLRRSIHEFRVRGFDRLKEEMPSVVGSYVITREWVGKSVTSDEEKGLMDSFLSVLGRYGAVVSFAANTTKLLEAASTHLPKLLPGG